MFAPRSSGFLPQELPRPGAWAMGEQHHYSRYAYAGLCPRDMSACPIDWTQTEESRSWDTQAFIF